MIEDAQTKKFKELKIKLNSDIYFREDFKRCISSSSFLDGIILKEVSKIHTKEIKELYTFLIFSSFCVR